MIDVIIGRHTWNCQIRKHIHTGYTHTGTHTKKEKRKSRKIRKIRKKKEEKSRKPQTKKEMGSQERKKEGKKKGRKEKGGMKEKNERKGNKEKNRKKKRKGDGFPGLEERGYRGGQDLILITLDRHECFSIFHHLQKDKQRKQPQSLKLGKKRRESSKRNYYIISPRVIIKAIIIMSTAFAVGPGYHLRLSEGGLGFVARPLCMGEEDPVVCCGKGRDQFRFFLVVEARPVYNRWLWSRDFFSPDSFLSSSSVFEDGWDDKGCIPLVISGLEDSFHCP